MTKGAAKLLGKAAPQDPTETPEQAIENAVDAVAANEPEMGVDVASGPDQTVIHEISPAVAGALVEGTVEKVKAKTKKAAAPVITDEIVATAHTVENLDKDHAFSMARELIEQEGKNDFVLGGILSRIQEAGFWENQGYESFRKFVEDDLSMGYRKAVYLIGIYNGLVESGVPWDAVKELGWTKLKELSGILTIDNVIDWVAKAKDMTVLQLQEAIKASKGIVTDDGTGEITGEVQNLSTVTFKVHEDQKAIVLEAIEKAKGDIKSEFPAVAMTHICTSYLETSTGKKKGKVMSLLELASTKSLDDILEVVDHLYGTKYNIHIEEIGADTAAAE
jgi:hypothetical protein